MSGEGEQSYYEIALTNRQVVVVFVCLLGSLVVVFFAGVWVGRVGTGPVATAEAVAEVEPTPPPPLSPATPLPDLPRVASVADPNTTLAEDIGRRVPPAPTPAPTPASTPSATPTPSPTPVRVANTPSPAPIATPVPRPSPARPEPTPQAALPQNANAGDAQVVQVFSSPDATQARKVLAELQGGGFEAFLSPVEVSGGTMYRVRLGPFDDRAAAEEAARRVRARLRLETWITSAAN